MTCSNKLAPFVALSLFCLALQACGSSGNSTVPVPSPTEDGFVFQPDGAVKPNPSGPTCTTDQDCPAGRPFCTENGFCVQCLTTAQCTAGKLCFNNECVPCNPGEKACHNEQVIQCKSDGSGFDTLLVCPQGTTCGNGLCLVCYPGTKKCEDNQSFECKLDGSGYDLLQDCTSSGAACALGVCISPCSGDIKANTNVGCGFFAVDLDNAVDSGPGGGTVDAQNAQFAVSASNTSVNASAVVTVWLPDGTKQEKTVLPLSLETFLLPPQNSLDGTGRTNSSYRIESTGPITLYQFNPLDNEDVFSNDASVLLPAASLGKEYFVVTLPQLDDNFGLPKFRGYVTIVGTVDAPSQVTITATTGTMAGGEFPALSPGQPYQFTIQRGEVVNIESQSSGGDLTGTHIVATTAIQVFGGHEAAVTGTTCCADHLEQQMVPVKAWGTEYVAATTWKRWQEKDYFRILAAQDGTTVTLNPAVNGNPVTTMNKGQFFEFQADSHFRITADKPIMVAQFLASSYEIMPPMGYDGQGTCLSAADCSGGYTCEPNSQDPFGTSYVCVPPQCVTTGQCPQGHTCTQYPSLFTSYCEPIGDPAMILLVPSNQWRKEYVFLTPNSYLEDYINVVVNEGASIVLDGVPIPPNGLEAVPGSTFKVYRTKVGDGVHTLTTSGGNASVIVYGYDDDVSYGYPGGVGLGSQ